MKPCQLLLVTSISPALRYGIGTYITQIIKGFAHNSEFIVSLIELDCNNIDGFLYTDDNGYHQYKIPPWEKYVTKENKKIFYDEATAWLASDINRKEPIIFHFNTLQDEELTISLKATFTQCRMVTTVHYFNWDIALSGNKWCFRRMLFSKGTDNRLEQILYKAFNKEKIFYSYMDHIVCLTCSGKSILNKDYNQPSEKLTIISNGLEDYKSVSIPCTASTIVPQETYPILLYVGRLDKSKGIHDLIKAFRNILPDYPKAQLLIAGDGNFQSCLKECHNIWGHVTFTGKVDTDTLHSFYSLAHLGIIPSYSEQCSYVAIEMMMHGLPFVGTNCDGLKEMLPATYCIPIHSKNELVYIDHNELTNMILHKLSEPKNGSLFRQLYEKRYQLKKMLEELKKIYKLLI